MPDLQLIAAVRDRIDDDDATIAADYNADRFDASHRVITGDVIDGLLAAGRDPRAVLTTLEHAANLDVLVRRMQDQMAAGGVPIRHPLTITMMTGLLEDEDWAAITELAATRPAVTEADVAEARQQIVRNAIVEASMKTLDDAKAAVMLALDDSYTAHAVRVLDGETSAPWTPPATVSTALPEG